MIDASVAKHKVREGAKKAVSQLILKLKAPLPEGLNHEKLKILVEGRIDAVVTCRNLLIGIADSADDRTHFWLRDTVKDLIEGSENAFDFMLLAMTEEIPELYDEKKLKMISQGKLKAYENAAEILRSIQDLESVLKKDGIEIRIGDGKISSGRIESIAQRMGHNKKGTKL